VGDAEPAEARASDVLPVGRSKDEARRLYDRIAPVYDLLSRLEQPYGRALLHHLGVRRGETALELGFGTGRCLEELASDVGLEGRVCGVDLSTGMVEAARRRLMRAELADRVALCRADASRLPLRSGSVDVACAAFTLELFEATEIEAVLAELMRVLVPGGRVGVVSLSREGADSRLRRAYEWAHGRWPALLDCRPIYVTRSLRQAGYTVTASRLASLVGLPVELVIAFK
jgi:demethylmenaquinone methyltransferase/2-methoxy-6-polyprenyl-1,4-benzoquinol methylase